ncbi:nucleotidyltransferase family protein [Aquimarina sp. U1-2]|uniref:nucleotidyltransferase family protein n=1 Tax=Aquimarina sp. U1-2 TaxID=2823141 RepID=UPI001AED0EBB|nr:nucleotidyltransferase family protein [Aquimarina sp. U1-2]MBP2832601.1 nucleotidyltransferase family protein [Aquimarina sp. U1-2]
MLTKEDIITRNQTEKNKIKSFGIRELGLFGSYVRGEQKEDSDIDILIDFNTKEENFRNFMDFCYFIDNLFNKSKVDVVTKNGLSKYIGPHILREVHYVKI